MKTTTLIIVALIMGLTKINAQYQITSPNKKIVLEVNDQNDLNFSISFNGNEIVNRMAIDLLFDNTSLFKDKRAKATKISEKQVVEPLVAFKNKEIMDEYNQLRLNFGNSSAIEFRAYNNGIAYRYITALDKEVEVNEIADITFANDFNMWVSPVKNFHGNYEVLYKQNTVSAFPDSVLTFMPVLMETENGSKLLVTETDIYNYPHMYFKKGDANNKLETIFPAKALKWEYTSDRHSKISERAKFLVKTNGNRSFPWRIFALAENDGDLLTNEMAYLLSRENEDPNTNWIKPGRVSWDWWNAMNLYDVDFKTGLNTQTWKYYIDFAAKNGLEYIILDEGWSISTTDLTKPNPNLDLKELIAYGQQKDVAIILWTTWIALQKNWGVLDKFKEWGIKGIKVDFMDRDDVWMVDFYEKVARECYTRQLLVDYHGSFKPTGMRRKYPNIMSYEGVKGLEYCKWSKDITPKHNATIPFIRMFNGPMDYTPGATRNHHRPDNHPVFERPVSQGTRCHQVALFVLYESGIQMFADSPSNYEREQETTEFLSRIPVTWDDIKVLEAKVGEYLILARKKGNKWFIGGITNEDPRSFTIDLSFLGEGNHTATIMQDGINADRFAEDFEKLTKQVSNKTTLDIRMVKGGGFAAIIE
jgi:alpha-glucosidase